MNLSIITNSPVLLRDVPCGSIYQVAPGGLKWLKIKGGSVAMHTNMGWNFVSDGSCNMAAPVAVVGKVIWEP